MWWSPDWAPWSWATWETAWLAALGKVDVIPGELGTVLLGFGPLAEALVFYLRNSLPCCPCSCRAGWGGRGGGCCWTTGWWPWGRPWWAWRSMLAATRCWLLGGWWLVSTLGWTLAWFPWNIITLKIELILQFKKTWRRQAKVFESKNNTRTCITDLLPAKDNKLLIFGQNYPDKKGCQKG